ncbi:MAG TPA: LysM peptidoglycan-binding domain-containing protein [Gemmataceae bacterium]|nr:LysM peptidoglycan-binding domain-containing protein [Gemmataceae bacterium]
MFGLNDRQVGYARGIVAAVKERDLRVRAAHIALETALTESGLWMYANGYNARSQQLPHDRVGWDHGSVGLFQQQVGGAPHSTADWGTTDELMDAKISCSKFLNALGDKWNNPERTNWQVCQSVQHSAFADGANYKANDARAIDLGDALWDRASPPPPPPPPPPPDLYDVLPGDNLSIVAAKFGTDVQHLVSWNKAKYPSLATDPNYVSADWFLIVHDPQGSHPTARSTLHPDYTVRPGDNLTMIARHYPEDWITAQSIAAANIDRYPSLASNPNYIEAGWRLRIR